MALSKNPKSKPLDLVEWRDFSYKFIAGVDEAGRGCLAGPVYAAAVILPVVHSISGISDSKLMTHKLRMEVAEQIKTQAVAWCIASSSVEEIEAINILRASLLAMRRAVEGLKLKPELLLVDGNQLPKSGCTEQSVINGDFRCEVIGAASILAKTARDLHMEELERAYPGYGLAVHKGYGTPVHRKAIQELGPTPIHRRLFRGVAEYCQPRP